MSGEGAHLLREVELDAHDLRILLEVDVAVGRLGAGPLDHVVHRLPRRLVALHLKYPDASSAALSSCCSMTPLPLRSILLKAARKLMSEISPLSSPLAACHASDADTVARVCV